MDPLLEKIYGIKKANFPHMQSTSCSAEVPEAARFSPGARVAGLRTLTEKIHRLHIPELGALSRLRP